MPPALGALLPRWRHSPLLEVPMLWEQLRVVFASGAVAARYPFAGWRCWRLHRLFEGAQPSHELKLACVPNPVHRPTLMRAVGRRRLTVWRFACAHRSCRGASQRRISSTSFCRAFCFPRLKLCARVPCETVTRGVRSQVSDDSIFVPASAILSARF